MFNWFKKNKQRDEEMAHQIAQMEARKKAFQEQGYIIGWVETPKFMIEGFTAQIIPAWMCVVLNFSDGLELRLPYEDTPQFIHAIEANGKRNISIEGGVGHRTTLTVTTDDDTTQIEAKYIMLGSSRALQSNYAVSITADQRGELLSVLDPPMKTVMDVGQERIVLEQENKRLRQESESSEQQMQRIKTIRANVLVIEKFMDEPPGKEKLERLIDLMESTPHLGQRVITDDEARAIVESMKE